MNRRRQNSPKDWPFYDPPNVAVFTTKLVVERMEPILYVYHDESDGAWQFHARKIVRMEEMQIVSLHYIARLDPSVAELADLQFGWQASRPRKDAEWIVAKSEPEV